VKLLAELGPSECAAQVFRFLRTRGSTLGVDSADLRTEVGSSCGSQVTAKARPTCCAPSAPWEPSISVGCF